MLIISDVHT